MRYSRWRLLLRSSKELLRRVVPLGPVSSSPATGSSTWYTAESSAIEYMIEVSLECLFFFAISSRVFPFAFVNRWLARIQFFEPLG